MRVMPGASRDRVGDLRGDRLKISITAPPVDGKANAHLLKFLARQFKVSRSCVTLTAGETSRNKTIRIERPAEIPAEFAVTGEHGGPGG